MKLYFGTICSFLLLGTSEGGVAAPTLAKKFDVRAPPTPKNCPFIPGSLPDSLPSPLPESLTGAFDDLAKRLDSGVGKTYP